MTILWSCESRRGFPIYIDLFENVPDNLRNQFTEWDRKLLNSRWEHNFLGIKVEPKKSNSTARMFNDRGNEYYTRKEWRQAIEYYNRGICFAKTNSYHESLVLAKRGFCYSNLNMFKEGIEDVENAINRNFPPNLISDIEKCQAEWRQEIVKTSTQNDQKRCNIFELSFDADDILPCMANVLEIREDIEFGTHAVAKTNIDIGQVVLVEDNFVSISNGYDRAYCATCLKTNQNFIPCSKCTDVMFCNNECLNRNEVHTIACGEVYNRLSTDIKIVLHSILKAIVLFPTVRLLMKFIKNPQLHQTESAQHSNDVFEYGLFLSLLSQSDELPLLLIYQVYKTLMSMPSIQLRFDSTRKVRFLMHLVCHHALVLKTHAFGAFETNQNQFIVGTMPNVIALFEHSCAPNLVRFSIDNREILITIRPVQAGDHLYYDYWLDAAKTDNRKTWMQTQGITCECGKCALDISINQRMSSDPSFFFILNHKKHVDSMTSPVLQENCLNFLRKFANEEWSREMEFVINTYIQCLTNALN